MCKSFKSFRNCGHYFCWIEYLLQVKIQNKPIFNTILSVIWTVWPCLNILLKRRLLLCLGNMKYSRGLTFWLWIQVKYLSIAVMKRELWSLYDLYNRKLTDNLNFFWLNCKFFLFLLNQRILKKNVWGKPTPCVPIYKEIAPLLSTFQSWAAFKSFKSTKHLKIYCFADSLWNRKFWMHIIYKFQ